MDRFIRRFPCTILLGVVLAAAPLGPLFSAEAIDIDLGGSEPAVKPAATAPAAPSTGSGQAKPAAPAASQKAARPAASTAGASKAPGSKAGGRVCADVTHLNTPTRTLRNRAGAAPCPV